MHAIERLLADWPDAPRGRLEFDEIRGGGNNRGYRVSCGERAWFLKHYRDRRRAEREYQVLSYLGQQGLDEVPSALWLHPLEPWAVYQFVEGNSPTAPQLEAGCAAALGLLTRLRQLGPAALGAASDSYLDSSSHLAQLEQRIHALETHLPEHGLQLRREWEQLCRAERPEPLEPAEVWLSPSDFGFHNALVRADGSFCFIDFEYAGRDECSKIVCDFFCQPSRPAPATAWESFVAILPPPAQRRLQWMWPVTVCKWACIILKPLAQPHHFASAQRDRSSQLAKLDWLRQRQREIAGKIAQERESSRREGKRDR